MYDKAVKKQFYDKLAYYYLELPKFTKNADELETIQDKWMFAIKNLSTLNDKPVALKEQVFTRLFRIAEIAKFSEKEKYAYEESLKKKTVSGNLSGLHPRYVLQYFFILGSWEL